VSPPSQESTTPGEETAGPPAEDPSGPPASEPEVSTPEPSAPAQEQGDSPQEQTQAPTQEPSPIAEELTAQPIESIDEEVSLEVSPEEPTTAGFNSITANPEDVLQGSGIRESDEILGQPSQLRQAAQSVVVPVQTKPQPWNSNTLLAGLVGLAVFALIAGLVVARRGVPGAIAN
jgi:hypothetical protein